MKMLSLIPELLVEDVNKSVRFYEEILGFSKEIMFPEKEPIFVQMMKDNIRIMVYLRSDFEKEIPKLKKEKMGGSVLLYIKVDAIESFFHNLDSTVKIIQTLHKTDYGSLEFTMEDCNGYLIAFSERSS